MRYDPNIKHRRSIRLPEFDYRAAVAYFVTICTFQRECILDEPRVRRAVELSWRSAHGGWEPACGDFTVMPNHVHGVIWLTDRRGVAPTRDVGAQRVENTVVLNRTSIRGEGNFRGEGVAPLRVGSLGEAVRMFKSLSTKRINGLRDTPGRPVWQRNYYERAVRDDDELQRIRQYILDNPADWQTDPNNPAITRTTYGRNAFVCESTGSLRSLLSGLTIAAHPRCAQRR